MEWLEISFHATDENHEQICQIFIDAGSKGVLLEDSKTPHEIPADRFGEVYRLNKDDYPSHGVIVKGYLPVVPQVDELLSMVENRVFELSPAVASTFSVTTLIENNWADSWKKHYKAIDVAENLRILPSWFEKSDDDVIEILLNPGMAFGSGTHETTRLCLQLLEKYVNSSSLVVDVGTGTGVLAITAAFLGAKSVYGVDLDEMAVIRAKENAILNNCHVVFEKNHLMDGVTALKWRPNLIVANILAPIILEMLADVRLVLNVEDIFICSGIIVEEKTLIFDGLKENGFEIIEVLIENGWVAIVAQKI